MSKRRQLCINLPDDVADYIDKSPNKTALVVEAVRLFMARTQQQEDQILARVRNLESCFRIIEHEIKTLKKQNAINGMGR